MMSKGKVAETSNKQVQTRIHCFPHIILSDSDFVKVYSDRSCQTAVSTTPDTTDFTFYALLQFIPYPVIAEESIKELDLPRRSALQWNLSDSMIDHKPASNESGIIHQKGVLKKKSSELSLHHNNPLSLISQRYIMQKSVIDGEAQTSLTVTPHVLDNDEVANVFAELSIQTSITCLPNESITNILPQLEANLSHCGGYVRSTRNRTNVDGRISSAYETRLEDTVEQIEGVTDDLSTDSSQMAERDVESGLRNSKKHHPQVKDQASCACGLKTINKVANQLRVQASTLKLTPQVFPPGAKFEDRIVEVINTTIAVLQTEMAKMLQMYTDENDSPFSCITSTTSESDPPCKSDCADCIECDKYSKITGLSHQKPCLREGTVNEIISSSVVLQTENENKGENADFSNEAIVKDILLETDSMLSLEETPQRDSTASASDPLYNIKNACDTCNECTKCDNTLQMQNRNPCFCEDIIKEMLSSGLFPEIQDLHKEEDEASVKDVPLETDSVHTLEESPERDSTTTPTDPPFNIKNNCDERNETDSTPQGDSTTSPNDTLYNIKSDCEKYNECTKCDHTTAVNEMLSSKVSFKIQDEHKEKNEASVKDITSSQIDSIHSLEESPQRDSIASASNPLFNIKNDCEVHNEFKECNNTILSVCEGTINEILNLSVCPNMQNERKEEDESSAKCITSSETSSMPSAEEQSQKDSTSSASDRLCNIKNDCEEYNECDNRVSTQYRKPCTNIDIPTSSRFPTTQYENKKDADTRSETNFIHSPEQPLKREITGSKESDSTPPVTSTDEQSYKVTKNGADAATHSFPSTTENALSEATEQTTASSITPTEKQPRKNIYTTREKSSSSSNALASINISDETYQNLTQTENFFECLGDFPENIPSDNIQCECHPTEAGAAPPIIVSSAVSTSIPCSYSDNVESVSDIANASSITDEQLSLLTDDVPSLAEDLPTPEKSVKFEIILKKNVEDVASASATSAIVVRATLSSPDTRKTPKRSPQAGPSLPDLREQIVRLSVIYKNGQDIRMEETLIPGRPITITSPNLHSSHMEPVSHAGTSVLYDDICIHAKGPTGPDTLLKPTLGRYEVVNSSSDRMKLTGVMEHKKPCTYPHDLCNQHNTEVISHAKRNTTLSDYEITISFKVEKEQEKPLGLKHNCDALEGEGHVDELIEFGDASTGVQTDLMLGHKLESESLNSVDLEHDYLLVENDSKTDIPWENISLPTPGTYSIRPKTQNEMLDVTNKVRQSTSKLSIETHDINEKDADGEQEQEVVLLNSFEVTKLIQKRTQPLLFESDGKYNEPREKHNCESGTEMPWKDIVLPTNCVIKNVMQGTKCICKNAEKISNKFITAEKPSKALVKEKQEQEEGMIQIHVGFDERPSSVIIVKNGASSQQTLSTASHSSVSNQQIKRVPKECILKLALTEAMNISVSFLEKSNCAADSKPLKNTSGPFKIPGNVSSQTKSCSTIKSSKMSGQASVKSVTKSSSSLPQLTSQGSIKATVSLKQLGQLDKVVSKTMSTGEGDSYITVNLPRESMSVELKTTNLSCATEELVPSKVMPAKEHSSVPKHTCLEKERNVIGCSSIKHSRLNQEQISTLKCSCVDKEQSVKPKRDSVIDAIKAYEAEMQPLLKAVTELQQKIRNLNISEVNDCILPHNRPSEAFAHRARTCVKPSYLQMTPPLIQPQTVYGAVAFPVVPSCFQSYIPSTPIYTACNTLERQPSYNYQSLGKPVKESPPKRDFPTQTKSFGASSTYYDAKKYQDEKRKGCYRSNRHKRFTTSYSSENLTSDHSDRENKYPFAVSLHKSPKGRQECNKCNKNKYKTTSASNRRDRCLPCKDFLETYLRPGKAVKTSPEQFFPSRSCLNRKSDDIEEKTSSSKSKSEFRFPYR